MAPPANQGRRAMTIEELCFTSAMSCFEGWLKLDPAIGPRTMAYVTKFISRTLDKTHNLKDVREAMSKSVEVWIWLTRDFAAAIPSLTTRSIGPLSSLNDPDKGVTPLESTALITKNYPSLKEDLQLLIKLMHIARNLLVVPEPEIPQDLCAAAQFDQMLYQTIILCINVTSKAYDGDVLEESARLKLGEITELCMFRTCPFLLAPTDSPRQKTARNLSPTSSQLDRQE
jgi:palmitoyltransferase